MQRLIVTGSYVFTKATLESALEAMTDIVRKLGLEYRTVKAAGGYRIPVVTQKFNIQKARVVDAVLGVLGFENDGYIIRYDRSDVDKNRIMITFLDPHAPKGRNFFSFVIEPNKQVRPVREG